MGGSHYHLVRGLAGGRVPRPDLGEAPRLFAQLHQAIEQSLVRSCHDASEGGLAVALAEMAFAGGVGADVTSTGAAGLPDEVALFSESTTRFIVEVRPERAAALEALFAGLPLARLGVTVKEPRLRITGASGEWVVWAGLEQLKEAWQKPLRW
jgi:phosphoribosylformylglycinamidine synthase